MEWQSKGTLTRDKREQIDIEKELEKLFSEHEFEEILCNGRCSTCIQKEWCLLTPASRCVK